MERSDAMKNPLRCLPVLALLAALLADPLGARAAQIEVFFPLGREAYQTNERIDACAIRSDAQPLPAAELTLTVSGQNGSRLDFVFPVAPAALAGGTARATEHFRLDGRLLRPGAYTIEASAHGAKASSRFEVHSHVRKSSFRTIDWGCRAQGEDIEKLGEDGLGFNAILGDFRLERNLRNAEAAIRGGADFLQCCTMGGGHQMDLRQECDWSDPLVLRGGTARAVQQAFLDRTKPNGLGVHFYDEPGLTWWKHPAAGKMTPHNVPAQDRAFRSAFGRDPLQHHQVQAGDPAAAAAWREQGRFKMSFLEAAWKDARHGVEDVSPGSLTATQSMYGFPAYADGYYFNVARSLPVLSGHGGYDDGPASYFYPSFHLELGRARDLAKPVWYLPVWYAGISSETFRLEQYLSFAMDVQGMAKPPDHTVHEPWKLPSAEGIVESNRLMARLGTIFTTLPVARGDVALLYSLSQGLDAQIRSGMEDNYEGGGHGRAKLLLTYLAGKMIHIPFFPVVEEDILDGTLAAHHKAAILAGIDFLEPPVVSALEAFAASGGLVLLTDDCAVAVRGARRAGAPADRSLYRKIEDLWKTDPKESMRLRAAGYFLRAAEPLARALREKLLAAGIRPAVECEDTNIVVSRHGQGDVEYIFAANATWDEKAGSHLAVRAATAAIAFPDDGKAIYDAVRGGPVPEMPGGASKGTFRFGPGQLRAFARTARPIGGVQVAAPVVEKDFQRDESPIRLRIAASVVDRKGQILSGSIPLEVRVVDPLGWDRHSVLRAADQGILRLELPLAANDPEGLWTVKVADLLSGAVGTAAFRFDPVRQPGALAGAARRAVSFGNDRENIFRFFRRHQDVTIVKGTSPFHAAAAARIAEALKPWGVRAKAVEASEVDRPREISEEEARTWVGLEFGRAEAGSKNSPAKAGFALQGPAIILGAPEDNPLVAHVERLGFLPYKPAKDFPGRGRGYMAWQRDALGIGQESIALIASDSEGMAEAVGTLYEAAAGLEPLTPLVLPRTAEASPATRSDRVARDAVVLWQAVLPDRILSLKVTAAGEIAAATLDGSLAVLDSRGKVLSIRELSSEELLGERRPLAPPEMPEPLKAKLPRARIPKLVSASGPLTAVGYWGGLLDIFSGQDLRARKALPQDISCMAWLGERIVLGLADGRVCALEAR